MKRNTTRPRKGVRAALSCYVSLFDGVGVVWHALDDVLMRKGLRRRLRAVCAVEALGHLADAMPRWWSRQKRLGPALLVERLAR
eukprot:7532264-Alexandrium_andersonii.AAC.1